MEEGGLGCFVQGFGGFRVAVEGDGKLSLFYFELKELLGLKIIFF